MPPPTLLSNLWAPLHMVILTTPTSDFPFTMSTNWTAISSPQRLWASLVLAPRWGQLMTFSWSTRARSCGGSCQKETPLSWLPWSAPGCEGNWRGGWQNRCHFLLLFCQGDHWTQSPASSRMSSPQQNGQNYGPGRNLSSITYYPCAFGVLG